MSLITFLLATLGSTFIITRSRLFEALREAAAAHAPFASYLVRCPQCCGFWSGVAWAAADVGPTTWSTWSTSTVGIRLVGLFAAGCASSIAAHVCNLTLERLQARAAPAPAASRILRSPGPRRRW